MVDKKLFNQCKKTPIVRLIQKRENLKKVPYLGMKVITPQRELIFKHLNKIKKLFINSKLKKDGIINISQCLQELQKFERKFIKYRNTDKFKNVDSYNIWKIIVSEFFYSMNS